MDRNQVRQVLTAQFYQSLADNGIQIQSIPQSELQGIVNALADGVFAIVAAVEAEADADTPLTASRSASPKATTQTAAVEEKLWRGRPYLSIGTIYELTTERLRILRGLFGNSVEEVELVRVKDTRVKQHVGERMLDVGDITVISEDPSHPELVLHNVSNPLQVRELIRKATIQEKERRGVRYREEF